MVQNVCVCEEFIELVVTQRKGGYNGNVWEVKMKSHSRFYNAVKEALELTSFSTNGWLSIENVLMHSILKFLSSKILFFMHFNLLKL